MAKKINISSVTVDGLQKGEYKTALPEFYALRSVVENTPWHSNQNVFDHSIAVFRGLEKVLKLDFLKGKNRTKIKKYLAKKIGRYTKKELLIVATLIHDIGKTETLVKDESGLTRCPAHEIIGSLMVGNFASRFNLDKKGKEYVAKIIRYHGLAHYILTLTLFRDNKTKYFSYFRKIVGDIYVEALLLMYADILGSDLKKINPGEFENRKKAIAVRVLNNKL